MTVKQCSEANPKFRRGGAVTDLHGPCIGSTVTYSGKCMGEPTYLQGVVVQMDSGMLTVLTASGRAYYCELDLYGTVSHRSDNHHVLTALEPDNKSVSLATAGWASDLPDMFEPEELESVVFSKLTPEVLAQVKAAIKFAAS